MVQEVPEEGPGVQTELWGRAPGLTVTTSQFPSQAARPAEASQLRPDLLFWKFLSFFHLREMSCLHTLSTSSPAEAVEGRGRSLFRESWSPEQELPVKAAA